MDISKTPRFNTESHTRTPLSKGMMSDFFMIRKKKDRRNKELRSNPQTFIKAGAYLIKSLLLLRKESPKRYCRDKKWQDTADTLRNCVASWLKRK